MTEWFEDWFGEEYLQLYAHRDEREAEAVVELIRRVAPWQSGGWVLDLACGAGRHAKYLVRGGARVIGYDLSRVLLRRAISMVGIPVICPRSGARKDDRGSGTEQG